MIIPQGEAEAVALLWARWDWLSRGWGVGSVSIGRCFKRLLEIVLGID